MAMVVFSRWNKLGAVADDDTNDDDEMTPSPNAAAAATESNYLPMAALADNCDFHCRPCTTLPLSLSNPYERVDDLAF